MTVAQLMAVARKRAGLLQREAAAQLMIDRTTLSLYELGRRSIPRDILVAAARLYRAPELLAAANEGPFQARVMAGDVELALDWFEEEVREALDAAARIARSLRRGERARIEDAEQVVDLRVALDTLLAAIWREGCPVDAAYERHTRKVQRYINRRPAGKQEAA